MSVDQTLFVFLGEVYKKRLQPHCGYAPASKKFIRIISIK